MESSTYEWNPPMLQGLIFVALEGSMLLSQFKDADYIRSVKASCLALLKR